MKSFKTFYEASKISVWRPRRGIDSLMPSDNQRSSFDYDPPAEHDAFHDTYNKAKYKSRQNNPRGSEVSHAVHAYKAVEKEHGPEGLKKLMSDHKQPGFRSKDTDEAQIALSRKKS